MASAFNFWTMEAMRKAEVTLVTSEATGFPIEFALDNNLDTGWKSTSQSTQTINIDLHNGLGEMIIAIGDSNFSAATNWADVDLVSGGGGYNDVTDLTISSGAAADYCRLVSAGFGGFVKGKTYTIEFAYTERAAGWQLQTSAGDVIGTAVAGANSQLTFTATDDADDLRIVATTGSADGDFDNVHIHEQSADQTIDQLVMWIRNYDDDYGVSTTQVGLYYSDDGASYVQVTGSPWYLLTYGGTGTALKFSPAIGEIGHRYWGVALLNLNVIPDVAFIGLGKAHTLAVGNQFPETDTRRIATKIRNQLGGSPSVRQVNSLPVMTYQRPFHMCDDTEYDALLEVVRASHGIDLPIVYQEGSDARQLVELAAIDFRPGKKRHAIHEPLMTFRTLPYVPDGGTI